MNRQRWVVYGDVQGVAFRAFARERAREAGVAGYARNRTDGTVEIEAEGTAEAVERLLAAVRRGPPAASVTEVRHEAPGSGPLPRPFRIEY